MSEKEALEKVWNLQPGEFKTVIIKTYAVRCFECGRHKTVNSARSAVDAHGKLREAGWILRIFDGWICDQCLQKEKESK